MKLFCMWFNIYIYLCLWFLYVWFDLVHFVNFLSNEWILFICYFCWRETTMSWKILILCICSSTLFLSKINEFVIKTLLCDMGIYLKCFYSFCNRYHSQCHSAVCLHLGYRIWSFIKSFLFISLVISNYGLIARLIIVVDPGFIFPTCVKFYLRLFELTY